MKKPVLLLVLMCLGVLTLSAQDADVISMPSVSVTDARLRLGAGFTYKIVKGLDLDLQEEVRLRNNMGRFDRSKTDIELSYKTCPYVKLGLGYTFSVLYKDGRKKTNYQNYWTFRHRVLANVMFMIPMGRWELSLRERFQAVFRTDTLYNLNEVVNPSMHLRTRVRLQYKAFSKPLKPYMYVEMYNPLNQPDYIKENRYWVDKCLGTKSWRYIDEVDARIGLQWRLTAGSSLDFYYQFEYVMNTDFDVKPVKEIIECTREFSYNHIVGISYNYQF